MNDVPTRFGRTVAGRADQVGVRQLTSPCRPVTPPGSTWSRPPLWRLGASAGLVAVGPADR